MDYIKDFTLTKNAGSTVTFEGEIPYSELEKEKPAALKKLGQNVKVDGFREGHVPDKIIEEQVGELGVITEMAERALAKTFPLLVKEHKVDAIGYPQITIKKIAKDNPFSFSATVAVLPEFSLPDYEKIAKEINKDKASTEVTEEDIEKQIKDIVRQKVAYERLQNKAAAKAENSSETDLPTPESEATKKAEAEADSADTPENIPDEELPELTDEFVKTLGQPGQFNDVAGFKEKLKEHLVIEKEKEVTSAHRGKLTDAIVEKTEIDLPQTLVDSEIEQMFAQMNEDLARMNLKLDDYLGHIKKTKEEMRKEWLPAAEKRAKLQLILNEIAKKEEVKPDEKLVAETIEQLKEQYKDADPERVKVYVESVLMNDAVMIKLESY